MKKYLNIVFILFVSLQSCKQNEKITSYFNVQKKLQVDKIIILEDLYLKLPKIFDLTDSSLVIGTAATFLTSGDHLIYVISKETGKIIKELGKGGKGPEELLTLNSIDAYENIINFYDATNRKILYYGYQNNSVSFHTLGSQQKYFFRSLYKLGDDEFLSCGLFNNNMYYHGSLTTGESSLYLSYPYLPDIPEEKQLDKHLARSLAYSGKLVKQPGKSRFAYFTRKAGYLQITEIKESVLKEVMHWDFAPPAGKIVFKVDAYVWAHEKAKSYGYFVDGAASEKYIYLLFSGKSIKNQNYSLGRYICVFDWNGNRIKILELDREVNAIAVDKRGRKIYAFTTNNKTGNNEILQYDL